jgi:hypothetical protein
MLVGVKFSDFNSSVVGDLTSAPFSYTLEDYFNDGFICEL